MPVNIYDGSAVSSQLVVPMLLLAPWLLPVAPRGVATDSVLSYDYRGLCPGLALQEGSNETHG